MGDVAGASCTVAALAGRRASWRGKKKRDSQGNQKQMKKDIWMFAENPRRDQILAGYGGSYLLSQDFWEAKVGKLS